MTTANYKIYGEMRGVEGKKISAIKAVRHFTDMGLKEAKQAVECQEVVEIPVEQEDEFRVRMNDAGYDVIRMGAKQPEDEGTATQWHDVYKDCIGLWLDGMNIKRNPKTGALEIRAKYVIPEGTDLDKLIMLAVTQELTKEGKENV